MTALLEVVDVVKRFRGLTAVDSVSLSVEDGEIFAIIGPNGAGKTTLFNLIAGVYAPDEGEVRYAGARIDGQEPEQICAAGIARTFQIVKPFPDLSVRDNVAIGAMLRAPDMTAARAQGDEILRKLDLFDKSAQKAGSLTLPDRKRLEVARALATKPRIILLDEVMAGLRPTETDRMVGVLRDINRHDKLTIVMIEHVMRAVMALADRVHVLHHGASIAEGAPQEVTKDARVIESYLGMKAAHEHFASPPLLELLGQRLGAALGRPLRVRVERVADAAESPADSRARASAERRQQAHDGLHADPAVQSLIDTFGARIISDSVRPLEN